MDPMIQRVYESIMAGDEAATVAACGELLAAGVPAARIVSQGMIPCMDRLGTMLVRREKFIPQVMMATRAMQSGLRVLSPFIVESGARPMLETVILGTVQGDIHVIGKTLVSIMLRGAGFDVVDLGTNVRPEAFVAAARERNARIIAISAMLTTTMPYMKKTIRALQAADAGHEWHILIGGAPVNGRFAGELGVEYAADAVETMNRALCICGKTPMPLE